MRTVARFTASNFQQAIHTEFDAAYMTVENPTGSPLFVRLGGRDFPNQSDADVIIPAGRDKSFTVSGHDFSCVFAAPSLVTGATSNVISGLYQVCIVTLYTADEKIPAFGDSNFLALSQSDMTNGLVAFANGTQQIFDMRAWGGAIILVNPDSISDQGTITVEISSESTFATANQRTVIWTSALWPSTPATIITPRVQGYMRVTFTDSGISVAAFSGFYAVRATIAEVLQPEFIPGTNTLSQAINVPNLSTQSFVYCTLNLPAISFAVSSSVASRNGEVVISTGDSAVGPWNTVSFREQVLNSTGVYHTIYQSLGDLGAFTKVDVLEILNTGTITGTIVASIRREPDLTGILHQIYATLGDVGETAQANQSIFALMQSVAGYLNLINTTLTSILASIGATLGADLGNIKVNIQNIWNSLGSIIGSDLTTIRTTLTTVSANVTSILSSTGASIGANIAAILTSIGGSIGANVATMTAALNTVSTNVASILTSLGASVGSTLNTISSTLSTISTNVASSLTALNVLVTSQTRGSGVFGGTFNITTLAFQNIGNLGAGPNYIQAISLEWTIPANGDPGIGGLTIAWGTGAGAVQTFYTCAIDGRSAGKGPPLNLSGIRTPGINLPAANTTLWVQSPIQPIQLQIFFYYT